MWYFAIDNGLLKNGSRVQNTYVVARVYTASCSNATVEKRFERVPGANTMSTGEAANQIWASPAANAYPARQPNASWSATTLLGSFSPLGRADLEAVVIDEYYGDTTTGYTGRMCCDLALVQQSTTAPIGSSNSVGTSGSTMLTTTGLGGSTMTDTNTASSLSGTTTATASSSSSSSSPSSCPTLPADVVDLALGCRADLKQFRVDCSSAVPLPDAANKIGSFDSLAVTISRCPAPAVNVSIVYQLALPNAVSLAAKSANIDVPTGPQTVVLSKAIDASDIEVPVWPSSGIVTIPKTAFSGERKIGIALVVAKPTINGAMLTFDVLLRACAALAACVDVPLASNQSFGFTQVCCIPSALQCTDELAKCNPTTTTTTAAATDTNAGQTLAPMMFSSLLFGIISLVNAE